MLVSVRVLVLINRVGAVLSGPIPTSMCVYTIVVLMIIHVCVCVLYCTCDLPLSLEFCLT